MRRSSPPTLKALQGLLVMSVALPLLAGCGGKDKAAEAPALATPVEAVAVSGPRTETLVSGTAPLERRREMALSFRIGGVLTRMDVEAGDRVKAGQSLASIDPANLEARQQQTSADLERARRDVERDRTLFDKGYVSRQRLDDRLSALKAAQAAHSSTSFDRRWAQLASPVSGVVLARNAQAGEVVQPGQVVLKVADLTSPLVLRLPLATRDAGRVRVGASARVRVAELGDQILNGTVTRVGEAADTRTGAVTVEIELSGRPDLRSGQIASADLSVTKAPTPSGTFARIPAEAVLEAEGTRAFVLRLDGGIARRIAVGFGGFDGDDALVSGLADGAQVITAGAGFVGDGEKVRLVDPSSLPATTTGSR